MRAGAVSAGGPTVDGQLSLSLDKCLLEATEDKRQYDGNDSNPWAALAGHTQSKCFWAALHSPDADAFLGPANLGPRTSIFNIINCSDTMSDHV